LKNPAIGRGVGRVAVLLAVTLTALPSPAGSHHNEPWAKQHFAAAERMREALNGRPPAQRTRRAYQGVISAYRTVYYGAPTSTKADPSVVAVAETMVEMGRRFQSEKILNDAIGQYKFLRREYPGSKYRFDALFTIAEVYKDDLNDPSNARTTFQEFLHRYPHNRLADDARAALTELDQAAKAVKPEGDPKSKKSSATAQNPKNSPKNDVASKAAKPDQSDGDQTTADDDSSDAGTTVAGADPHQLPRVTGIRHWSTPDYTRIAIDVEANVKFGSQRIANPDRIFFDLRDTRLASTLVGKTLDVDDGFLKKIRVAQFEPGRTRVVLEVDSLSSYNAFLLPDPYRLIIDIHGKGTRKAKAADDSTVAASLQAKSADPTAADDILKPRVVEKKAAAAESSPAKAASSPKKVVVINGGDDGEEDAQSVPVQKTLPVTVSKAPHDEVADDSSEDQSLPPAGQTDSTPKLNLRSAGKMGKASDPEMREARPTATGDRSLIRALGLKIGRIVIDPGHGGHDTGTIGPNGLEEKALVVDVGRRLGKLLETRMGADVVYTRKDDTFIPLETRTAIANRERADLFISIHANSSRDPSARGVETYYLNFTSSPEALEVAARENAVSDQSIHELQDLVKKIALKEKIDESREFASDVEESLHAGLASKSPGIRDRGVKKAPFIVLIGANMPSILAEISFVSNPADEKRLATGEYRQKIAESLYRGIAKYVSGLSGVKVASRMDKVAGQ
jgi:N-acetylmuramoyl-L-alanine amidase